MYRKENTTVSYIWYRLGLEDGTREERAKQCHIRNQTGCTFYAKQTSTPEDQKKGNAVDLYGPEDYGSIDGEL